MDIAILVDRIRSLPGCTVLPSLGLPMVCEQHVLPEDLKQFYRLCGGVTLYDNTTLPIKLLPPYRVVLANSYQLIGLDDEDIAWYKEHQGIIWSWYLIADYGNSNFVSIDLSQERLGRCYDSHHERYPEGPIVAHSFTELLDWLLMKKWPKNEDPVFRNLGSPFA